MFAGKGRNNRATASAAVLASILVCLPAAADVEGVHPSLLYRDRIWGSVTTAGATMMDPDYQYYANRWLKPENSVDIRGIPLDAQARKAYLWWSGSMDLPPEEGGEPDEYVDLILADGTVFTNLWADDMAPGPGRCVTISSYGGFYYCRKDITDLVKAQGSGNYNGVYTLSNMYAKEGDCSVDTNCQARYGAFALSIVWESTSYGRRRDVVLYDGFLAMQERNDDPEVNFNGVTSFELTDFLVGDPPRGEFTLFGLEGDQQLGSPPFPVTNGDWMKLDGTALWNPSRPGVHENPPYNLWNSSEALGVDIDHFDIGNTGLKILKSGQTRMRVDCGSGDGVPGVVDPEFTSHDMVILGWVALALDTLAPNFENSLTRKDVDKTEAAPGEILTYTITLTNTGSADATDVILFDTVPEHTEYVPGSTRIIGSGFVPDQGGASALESGLHLGDMGLYPDPTYQVQVEFKVRVKDDAPAGSEILNIAKVGAREIDPPVEAGRALTTVIAPELGSARKTWSLVPGDFDVPGPGSTIKYTIELDNDGAKPAGGITFSDELPPYFSQGFEPVVQASSAGTTSVTWTGDRWRIQVHDITVPAGWTAKIEIIARVFSEDEFVASGIDADEIDGLVMENQGVFNAPYLAEDLLTDDPGDPTSSSDPTRITLVYAPVMSSSNKTVAPSSQPVVPGTILVYTVEIRNTGNRPAEILGLSDPIDPLLEDVSIDMTSTSLRPVRIEAGRIVYDDPNPFPVPPGGSARLVFSATIKSDASHGAKVSNTAFVDMSPDPDLSLQAPDIVVVNRPVFDQTSKTWSNDTGPPALPGQELEFTFHVVNTGTGATGTVLEDPLDLSFVEYVSGGDSFDPGSGVVTFDLGEIEAGGERTVSLKVRLKESPPADEFQNCGRIKADQTPDWSTIECVHVPVKLMPVLSMTKNFTKPSSKTARPGDDVQFTITISNTGSAPANSVLVQDVLDPRLEFTSAPGSDWDPQARRLSWSLGLLEAGSVVTLTVDAKLHSPLDPGVIDNEAVLTADEIGSEIKASDQLTIVSDLLLAFSKDVDAPLPSDGAVVPGRKLVYTLKVFHAQGSTRTAKNIVVADPLAGLLDQGWLTDIDPGNGTWNSQQRAVVWTAAEVPALAALEPGQVAELHFSATVVKPHADGEFSNQAGLVVDGDTSNPVLSDDPRDGDVDNDRHEPTAVRVENGPAFWNFTKTADKRFVKPGDRVVYTMELENTGTGRGENVVVSDLLETGLSPIQGTLTVSKGTAAFQGNGLTWSVGEMSAGEKVTASFGVIVDAECDQAPKDVPNQAFVQASGTSKYQSIDPDPPAELPQDGKTWIRVSCEPDISNFTKTVGIVNKAGNPDAVYPGYTELHYEIRVVNSGGAPTPSDFPLIIYDRVPQELEVIPESVQGARLEAGAVVTDGFVLSPGEEKTVRYTALVKEGTPAGTLVQNQARIGLSGAEILSDGDGDLSNGRQPTVVGVDYPDLSNTTKDVESPGRQVEPGQEVTYLFRVVNKGTLDASELNLTDVLDTSSLEYVSGDGTFDQSTGTVTFFLESLGAGTFKDFRFVAKVKDTVENGRVIHNQGDLEADQGVIHELTDDPATPDLDDPTDITVVSNVEFKKTVFVGGAQLPLTTAVKRGTKVDYVLDISNATGKGVEVRDAVPLQLESIEVGDDGYEYDYDQDTHTITWRLGDLGPGTSLVLHFSGVLSDNAPPGKVSNQAVMYVSGTENARSDDPRTEQENDPTVFDILEPVDFSRTEKTVPSHPDRVVAAGDEVLYKISIFNDGPQDSEAAVLHDTIPAMTEYVPGSTRLNGMPVPDSASGGPPFGTIEGMLVSSPGAPEGVVWADGGSAWVEFKVRVGADAPMGGVITNQARISDSRGPVYLSDDPRTPALDDPTVVTVGKAADLSNTTKTASPARVKPGQELEYLVVVRNTGTAPAKNVVFQDEVPALTEYVAGSMRLGDKALTDRADEDEGKYDSGRIVVEVPEIQPLDSVEIRFRVKALEEGMIVNQGTVNADGLAEEETDSDGDDSNGDQPTRTPCGYNRQLNAEKSVQDVDGGSVLPGDILEYAITVFNPGVEDVDDASVRDELPARVDYVENSLQAPSGASASFTPPPAGAGGKGMVKVDGLAVPAGGSVVVRFRVKIDPETPRLTKISNIASIEATGVDRFDTDPAVVIVGQVQGAAAIQGRVFEDRGEPNKVLDLEGEHPDALFEGYKVVVVASYDEKEKPLFEAETDAKGIFQALNLPAPGKYTLKLYSPGGALLLEEALEGEVEPDQVLTRNLRLNPTGRIYVSGTGRLLVGAKVFLHEYDPTAPGKAGKLVDQGELPEGQQGQVTGKYGVYQFDPPSGRYVVSVQPPGNLLLFPSASPPPSDGPAQVDQEHGFVVEAAEPDLRNELKYYLELQVDAGTAGIHHNHIPVDPISRDIKFELKANKRELVQGEVVTFLAEAANRSARDLAVEDGSGGVYLRALLPQGFRFVNNGIRVAIETSEGKAVRYSARPAGRVEKGRALLLGPFSLYSGGELKVMFQAVAGAAATRGDYITRAVLQSGASPADLGAGIDVSQPAEARVRIVSDPLFDRGYVMGKVFCDQDGDGSQDPGEPGVAGVEVYSDTGRYSITDSTGKYHLQDLPPGMRAFKPAAHTLPPSSRFTTDETRLVRVSAGAVVEVNFGVTCPVERVRPEWVELAEPEENDTGRAKAGGKAGEQTVETGRRRAGKKVEHGEKIFIVKGNVRDMRVTVDGREVPRAVVDIGQDPGVGSKIRDGVLEPAATFLPKVEADEKLSRWYLEVRGPTGRLVHRMEGDGAVPPVLSWDGTDPRAGPLLLADEEYKYRLFVVTSSGTLAFSPAKRLMYRGVVPPGKQEVEPRVLVSGREAALDESGGFSTTASAGRKKPLVIEMIGPAGNGMKVLYSAEGRSPVWLSPTGPAPTVLLDLYGNLKEKIVHVDGKPIDTGLLSLRCDVKGTGKGPVRAELREGRLDEPVRITPGAEVDGITTWHILLRDSSSRPVAVIASGKGRPSSDIIWDGRLPGGGSIRPGLYFFRLAVRTADDQRGLSPPKPLFVTGPSVEVSIPADKVFVPGTAKISRKGRRILKRQLVRLRKSGSRVAVEVHSDEGLDPSKVLALTQKRADAVKHYLVANGFKPQDVSAVGLGDLKPLVPNINRRSRAMNRRVVLLAGSPPIPSVGLVRPVPEVQVNDRRVAVDSDAGFKVTLAVPRASKIPLKLHLVAPDGSEAFMAHEVKTRGGETEVATVPSNTAGEVKAGSGPGLEGKATASGGVPGEVVREAGMEGEQEQRLGPKRVRPTETDAPAGRLTVEFPPAGAAIQQDRLVIRGYTDPSNEVKIDKRPVKVDSRGIFEYAIELKPGEQVIKVEALDTSGNKAVIERKVVMDPDYWFVLAMADGVVGTRDVKLDEMNKRTTLDLASGNVRLHGRAAAFVKARITAESGPFEKYEIIGHLDTGKEEERTLISRVNDPEKYYAVYGDASSEIVDVNSRERFFLLVKADQTSELRVGNFETGMKDGDLFKFERTSFGARAVLDHEFVKGYRSRARAFVTDSGIGTVHGHDELKATGGSVYYLKHMDVVEGSDQVMLVIRDRDTNMILMTVPLTRDDDYVIRYQEGRIILKNPVSSVVDASFTAVSGVTGALDGNPVYLVADYEAVGNDSRTAWGVHAKQTFFDMLTFGGGYVTEENPGTDPYELWATSGTLKLAEHSEVRLELAHSHASGGVSSYSEDGGLTFSPLDDDRTDKGGYAYKIEAGTDLADWLGMKREFFGVRGYYQNLDPGFFSGNTLQERGQQRFGASVDVRITQSDRLLVRHDGMLASLPGGSGSADVELNKQISSLKYLRNTNDYVLSIEYGHTYTSRDAGSAGVSLKQHVETTAAGFKYNFTDRWSGYVKQQVDVPHGEGAPEFTARDVKTSLGGAYKLEKDLWITAGLSEQWSGDTGVEAGLKSALSDDTDVYLKERLSLDLDGETVSTTIFGGENRIDKRGRVFGEYRVDSGAGAGANRAVIGLANRWKLMQGLYLDLSAERQQVRSDSLGDSARSVGSVGYEYLKQEWLKLSGRYELRYDQQEESRGGRDRIQFLTLNAANWRWTRDLTFLARLNYSQTEDLSYKWTDALLLELTAGLAYRPAAIDWLSLLFKYTKRIELRRDTMSGFGPQKWDSDVLVLAPVVELPFHVQLSQTVAFRYRREWVGDMQQTDTMTLLSLSRVGFHLTDSFDVAVEYRLRRNWIGVSALDLDQGLLTEVSYEFLNHVRIGVGYNFSNFSDNLYSNIERNEHGFFFRVMGKF